MAEGKQAKYSEPVTITAQSVSNFLEMLAAEGLKEKFLDEAPEAKTVLAAGQSDEIRRSARGFSAKTGVKPDVLASRIDKLAANRTNVPAEVWQASMTVEPELMEFARAFVSTHNLTAKIAKSLQAGKCGDGRECPPGV